MENNSTYLYGELLQEVWGNYGYNYNLNSETLHSGYNEYGVLADVPIILAKLFKTEYGESADIHIACCIKNESTYIRSIQKNGYWGCEDNNEWSSEEGRTCSNYYNSINTDIYPINYLSLIPILTKYSNRTLGN